MVNARSERGEPRAARQVERAPVRSYALFATAAASLALYLVAAARSKGILHFDEFFQTVDVVNYKLGRTGESDLPWEFKSHIRPWLQPFLYWCVIAPARSLGVSKPATWWTICRWMSALFGWASAVVWARSYPRWFRTRLSCRLALATLVLSFFMPMLHARTSSENSSGTAMMMALGWLVASTSLSPDSRPGVPPGVLRALGMGLLMGFGFEFRYQAGIMVAGTLAWCVFYRRIPLKKTALVFAGVLAALAIGWGVDAWGYHAWKVFPAFGYAKFNVVENGAAGFGTSPWWAYFDMLLEFATPPLGVFLWLCFGVFWVTQPSSLLTWVTLPFFLVHCALAHKEMRFLFPMLYFAPTIVALTVQSSYRALRSARRGARVRRAVLTLSLLLLTSRDLFLLVRATALPLESKFVAEEKIADMYVADEKLFTVEQDSPFDYGNLPVGTYGRALQSSWIKLPNALAVLPALEKMAPPRALLWVRTSERVADAGKLAPYCRLVWSGRDDGGSIRRWFGGVFGVQYLRREDRDVLECSRLAHDR